MSTAKRLKVLHVVGAMSRGGIETWLMHVLRHIDRTRFQLDFVVHTDQPGAYDDEVRALGGRILPCLPTARPLAYRRAFRRILDAQGPYQVVHSHVHHFSGIPLWVARQAGVSVRIAHSHLDTAAVDAHASLPRRAYLALMRAAIARHATLGFAASRRAAPSLFGADWERDPRWRVFFCAVDLAPFDAPLALDPAALRAALGLPHDAFVVGHVGRFAEQKNHAFFLQVAKALTEREPHAAFLLVGDGELRPTIEAQAAALGLSDRVVFAGLRADVPQLMRGAMDAFLFPSLYEGLPLVIMEVQAAGLPALLSDTITSEVHVVAYGVRFLSLDAPPSVWAEALLELRRGRLAASRAEALAQVQRSPFNIEHNIRDLERCYRGEGA